MDSATTPNADEPNANADWCQIQETLAMLYLSSAQIETSMHEDTVVFQQLSDALISISQSSQKIETTLGAMAEKEISQDLHEVQASAKLIGEQIGLSLKACQFHDRNTQKLEHVTSALSKLSGIISTPDKYHSPDEWQQLQSEIKGSYTMEVERLMFEHIMMGASVEEALEIYHHNFNHAAPDDDSEDEIELF